MAILKARGRLSPRLLSLATLEIPTHSHISVASRVQFMTCKPALVFTALASVGIIKQGKNQSSYVEGQHIPMAISTDASKVVSDTLLKETTHNVWSKCREMPFSHPKLNVNHNPPLAACAQCVYGRRPCMRKARGALLRKIAW